ncbi:MAG: FAD-binding oxidoreductase [Bacillota bacterium]|nr:FAD-binding oxidoreductase [Bacillota bacterium]
MEKGDGFLSGKAYDVIVVGAGAVGMSAARSLLAQGVERIAVVEREGPAAGSTSRAAGIVSVLTWDEHDALLVKRSAEIYRDLAARFPGRFRYHGDGMVTVANRAATVEAMEPRIAALREVGLEVQELSCAQAQERWSDLVVEDAQAIWYTPGDGQVYGYDYVQVVLDEMQGQVDFYFHHPLQEILQEGDRVVGVLAGDVTLSAPRVLLATGVWTRKVLGPMGMEIPIKPYRTQISVWTADSPVRLPILHDLDLGFYWVPDGQKIIFGDGTEHVESDPYDWKDFNDEEFILAAGERLAKRFVHGQEVRLQGGWAGLCDATPDRHPLLGAYGPEGLFLAVGFNGFGIMRAPAVGEEAARLVLGKESFLPMEKYGAVRFPSWVDFPITEGFNVVS